MKKALIALVLALATLLLMATSNRDAERPPADRVKVAQALVLVEETHELPAGSAAAAADNPYTAYRYPRKTICAENLTGSAWWRDAMVGATVNWRQAGMNVFYRERGQCPTWMVGQRIEFRVMKIDNGACGTTQWWLSNGKTFKAVINLNMHAKVGYVNCRLTFAKRLHLVTHEVGHAIALGHNGEQTSVMNVNGPRPYKPSTNDLARVGYAYQNIPL